jgi:hypothetical protein
MQTRRELYDLIGYSDYERFDAEVAAEAIGEGSSPDLSVDRR